MDSGPMKVEPSFDALKPDMARDAAPGVQPKDGAAPPSRPAGEAQNKGQDTEKPKENSGPKLPPIPSSALVILPPPKHRFDAKVDGAKAGRAGKGKWLRYGSRAALILILCGSAFAAGGHFLGSTPLAGAANSMGASWWGAKNDSDADARAIAALGSEVKSLQARIDSLRADSDEIGALKSSVDGLKASFTAEKGAASASIAQLSTKLDQIERADPRLTQASLERSERAESTDPKAIQATLDKAARGDRGEPITTASIPPGAEPQNAMTEGRPLGEPHRPPPLLTNWVVRDVYDGIALVEGPEGALEVMPGDTIPGAGTVKSIERRGGGWIVLTSRGVVAYAGD
jgi:hypothetical protein